MTLPALHLPGWRPTKDTLHLYCQIVGKVRLATTPPRNQWWNAPLYVDVRGLTTRRLHQEDTTFQIDFDFVDHSLTVRTDEGRTRSFDLADGVSVADFDARLHEALSELEVDVAIKEQPFGVPMTTPFPEDREHASWDRDAIDADPITREAYSQEVISFGFWAGDDNVEDAAYYSYTAPEPAGLRDQPLPVGDWVASGSGWLALLPCDLVRTARDPRGTLLAFMQGAYEAGARLARWDTSGFESKWCPTPRQLHELHATAAYEFGRPAYQTASAGMRR